MSEQHVTIQISDYVLGLLPPQARRDVEGHIAHCETCRASVQRERELVQLVRGTLKEVIRPNPTHLQQFTPPTLTVRRTRRQLRQAIAVVTLLLVLFLGNLGWQNGATGIAYASPAPAFAQSVAVTPIASGTPLANTMPITVMPVPIPTPATPHLK